jgi:tetratricopeptide (TPR) repeat protein
LSAAAPTAEEVVTNKINQFASNRREVVHAMARQLKIEVPVEVERFFDAVEAGRWDEVEGLAKALRANLGRPEEIKLWPAINEVWGAVDEARVWPAQKLLDYGNAILGSLRPGMVYLGGTDPGRWIPTMLNETSEGEHHIVLSQNALADGTYLNYLTFLYGDRLATLTHDDSERAFQEYLTDAQKRFMHDQQFPDQPKQVRPGEEIRSVDNRIQVSGQVAVMSIVERLLQGLMGKNPDTSFAMEESYPLKSTYSGAVPLGPVMELRAQDGQNALTAERAAQSIDFWHATTQQLLEDPEAAGSQETRNSYGKMAVAQGNLLANGNYKPEAEQAYRLARQLAPESAEAVTSLAELLSRTGRAEEARQCLDVFARDYPEKRAAIAPR